MEGIIYIITNKLNNKVYIGQTIQNLKDRWYRHCQKSSLSIAESNMAIKKAIFKYGKDNFTIEVLDKCDIKLLNTKEKFYIEKYNSYKEGYNSTIGGQEGVKPLKTSLEDQSIIIELYTLGFSLREIGKEFNIDKTTVKNILSINNITLRRIRNYKYSQEVRINIINDYNKGLNRLYIMDKYKISKGYLSQLINNKRRI